MLPAPVLDGKYISIRVFLLLGLYDLPSCFRKTLLSSSLPLISLLPFFYLSPLFWCEGFRPLELQTPDKHSTMEPQPQFQQEGLPSDFCELSLHKVVKSTHHQIVFPHPLFWLLPDREHGFVKLGVFWHEEHTCSHERFSHVLPLMNYSIRCSPLCTGYKFSFFLFCQKEEESLASFFFFAYISLC